MELLENDMTTLYVGYGGVRRPNEHTIVIKGVDYLFENSNTVKF